MYVIVEDETENKNTLVVKDDNINFYINDDSVIRNYELEEKLKKLELKKISMITDKMQYITNKGYFLCSMKNIGDIVEDETIIQFEFFKEHGFPTIYINIFIPMN